jgi:hypothetical protein
MNVSKERKWYKSIYVPSAMSKDIELRGCSVAMYVLTLM